MIIDISRLEDHLARWGRVEVLGEIAQSNRASRTWLVAIDGIRAVAKLTFDSRDYVEPGLLVAEYVQHETGIQTGTPLRTRSGEVTLPWPTAGAAWTLAVLSHVDGLPLVVFDEATARAAGRLLARIHRVLMAGAPRVPGQLLAWSRSFAMERDDTDAIAVLDAVAEIETRQPLTYGVVYGDPSPELVMTPDAELGLIDWGTPSWGPVMYDVATWIGHVSAHSPTGGPDGAALLEEYVAGTPWGRRETVSLPYLASLWRRLTTT